MFGEPIIVKGTSEEELEDKRKELTASLNAIMARADAIFKPPDPAQGE